MNFEYIGERDGCHYWHYITGRTVYVIVKSDEDQYRAFYHRNNGETYYLLHTGFDCRIKPFSSFLQAERACGNKLKALRGV